MNASIREARREGAPAIVGLIQALAEFEQLPGPDADAAARLVEHGFGERRHFESLVAEADGAIVGYAIYVTTYSTFRMRPTLFLEDLFVHPDARRHGIATALYAKLGAQQLDAWRLCRVDL